MIFDSNLKTVEDWWFEDKNHNYKDLVQNIVNPIPSIITDPNTGAVTFTIERKLDTGDILQDKPIICPSHNHWEWLADTKN